MTLSDILLPPAVILPLDAADRDTAISKLVDALGLQGDSADRERLKNAILAREAAGSTGIGNGVAIPHARSQRLTRPRLAVGKTSCPVDFKSADGKPVSLIFLLAVPEVAPQSHLRVLASLSRIALDKKFLRGLIKSSSAQELFELVAGIPV